MLVPGGLFLCLWNQFICDQDWEKGLTQELLKVFSEVNAPIVSIFRYEIYDKFYWKIIFFWILVGEL